MKLLQENYKIFVFLGICPPDKPTSRWKKLFYISILINCLSVVIIALISSAVFFMKNISSDLENAICACFQIAAALTAIYSFITTYIKRHDLKETFDAFQTFYDASKSNKFNIEVMKLFTYFIFYYRRQ